MTTSLYYLGPRGTFTHQAAMLAVPRLNAIRRAMAAASSAPSSAAPSSAAPCDGTDLAIVEAPTAADIFERVSRHEGWGVIAWENNVEGYVVPNLDALLDARDVVGIDRVSVDIAFDAFVSDDHGELTEAAAHPHGLAQCAGFLRTRGLRPHPADSNAAACRDIGPHQVALGPRLCGDLYGLQTLERNVQDFQGARTDFLVIVPRGTARAYLEAERRLDADADHYESILGLVPLHTGPGTVATMLDVLRDAGLNMTSFISRPIKGRDGTYSFIATIDAAPWKPSFREALRGMTTSDTWAKTLAVYERRDRPDPPISAWMLPDGGVRPGDDGAGGAPDADGAPTAGEDRETRQEREERELLWR